MDLLYVYFNLFRFGSFRFGYRDFQNAVLIARGDFFRVDLDRQFNGAMERSKDTLGVIIPLFILTFFTFSFALDHECISNDRDIDIFFVDSRDVGADYKAIVLLPQIQTGGE